MNKLRNIKLLLALDNLEVLHRTEQPNHWQEGWLWSRPLLPTPYLHSVGGCVQAVDVPSSTDQDRYKGLAVTDVGQGAPASGGL